MSATSYMRHRRFAAAAYIRQNLARNSKAVGEILERNGLNPGELGVLASTNDSLTIADEIAALKLDEPELDSLEELNVIETETRAAVHAPDVREDQFEEMLQHPCQETVGVGNMHDTRQMAAENIVNVSADLVAAHGGSLADAAAELVKDEDKLRGHAALPEVYPSVRPAADQVTAEDEQKPTDPEGTQEGVSSTPVNKAEAIKVLRETEKADDAGEDTAESLLAKLKGKDRDGLVAYAAEMNIDIGDVKDAAKPADIRKLIIGAVIRPEPDSSEGVA